MLFRSKQVKKEILKNHTLEGVISLNKDTFYRVGTVPCIAVFSTGEPHPKEKLVKFINFENDGFEVKKHLGLVETERARDRKQFLLDCWKGKVKEFPSSFMVETTVEDTDEWLHSFQTVDKVGAGIVSSTTFLHIAILLPKILKNQRILVF